MKMPRPKTEFAPEKKARIEYKIVSYRLPSHLVEELGKYVDKEDSASKLISEILNWALPGLKKNKGKKK
jgi:hypothetical protein